MRDAALQVASFPEAVREVNGKVTFSARRVLLEDFTAKVAGGRVGLRGEAGARGSRRRQLRRCSSRPTASRSSRATASSSSSAAAASSPGSAATGCRCSAGELRIDEFAYTRPIKMDRTLGEMYGPERAEVPGYDPEADLLGDRPRSSSSSKPLYIRNNLIDAELRLE